MNICGTCFCVGICFHSLGYIPKSGTAGTYSNFMCNIFRIFQSLLNFMYLEKIYEDSGFLYSHQHLLLFDILEIASPADVKWYLIMA